MSAMVLSSVKRFIEMSTKLEELGLDTIHFYNVKNDGNIHPPILALVPFVDCVILSRDADISRQLSRVIDEAFARHIPVLSEECLNGLKNFY